MLAAKESVDFFWKVAPGHHCQDSTRGRVLVEEPGIRRVYRPLGRDTALFLKFSRLNQTEEAILFFARHYGLLTSGTPDLVTFPDHNNTREKEKSEEESTRGELIELWKSQIEQMKFAVSFWQAVKKKNEDTLRRYLAITSRTWDFRRADSGAAVWFAAAGHGDNDETAWRVLSQLMQDQLVSGIH